MRKVDMVGRRFGRLTALELFDKKGNELRYKCLCDCGGYVVAFGKFCSFITQKENTAFKKGSKKFKHLYENEST